MPFGSFGGGGTPAITANPVAIGSGGSKLKDVSGVLEAKNNADSALVKMRVLDPVGSTDVDTLGARNTAIAAAIAAIPAGTAFFGVELEEGGAVLTAGAKKSFVFPKNMTITGWTLISDVSGNLVIDVWKDSYANYPPTVADTITGSEKPTLSSAIKNQDLSLTTWTTSVTSGQTGRWNVDSCTTITWAFLLITGTSP